MNETGATPRESMGLRILAGLVALPTTVFALLIAIQMLRTRFDPMGAAFGACAATVAILGWWFALRGHIAESRARIKIALIGGLMLGGIGFALGFFGPLLLAPDANQGPLLGIFFTGPLGFVLGTAIGWLYAVTRERRRGGARATGNAHGS